MNYFDSQSVMLEAERDELRRKCDRLEAAEDWVDTLFKVEWLERGEPRDLSFYSRRSALEHLKTVPNATLSRVQVYQPKQSFNAEAYRKRFGRK
jgi:hypothetical protein